MMKAKRISIRELAASDVEAVAEIYASIIHPSYLAYGEVAEGTADLKGFSKNAVSSFRKEILGSTDDPSRRVFAAMHEKCPIGFAYAEIKRSPAGHRECWIHDLGVSKEFRKMGTAKKLLDAARSFGKKHKAKYILLESGHGNKAAHHLFEKEKFVPLSIIFIRKN